MKFVIVKADLRALEFGLMTFVVEVVDTNMICPGSMQWFRERVAF